MCGLVYLFIFGYSKILKDFSILNIELDNLDQSDILDKISHAPVKEDLKTFQESLINFQQKTKSLNEAQNIFLESYRSSKYLNTQFLQSVPHILVGIGIVGTFLGLAVGVENFDSQNAEQIRKSIEYLLEGMSLAFLSSIFGLGTSVIFQLIDRNYLSYIYKKLRSFCKEVDSRYYIDPGVYAIERNAIAINEFKDMLQEQWVEEKEGDLIMPKHRLRELFTHAEKQTHALEDFSADLAVELGEIIENKNEIFKNSMGGVLDDKLMPAFEKLDTAIDQLIKTKEQSSDAVINNAIGELQQTLQQMGEDFSKQMMGGIDGKLNTLVDKLEKAGNTIGQVPANFQDMMGKMQQEFEETSTRTSEDMATVSSLIKEEFKNLSKEFGQTLGSMKDILSNVMERQETTVNSMDGIVNQAGQMANISSDMQQKFANSIDKLDNLSKTIDSLSDKLLTGANKLYSSSGDLSETSKALRENLVTYVDQTKNSLNQISKQLAHTENFTSKYTERFEGMKENLKTIQNGTGQLIDKQFNSIESIADTLDQIRATNESSADLSVKFNTTISGLDKVSQQIQQVGNSLRVSTSNLDNASRKFDNSSERISDNLNGSVDSLEEALETIDNRLQQSSHLMETYSNQFGTIKDNLGEFFGQLGDNMDQYREKTREDLNMYLREFSDNLSKAAKGLHDSSSAIRESIDDINDTFEKIRNQATLN